jgi:endo-1,4-beta-D-glucanase Y
MIYKFECIKLISILFLSQVIGINTAYSNLPIGSSTARFRNFSESLEKTWQGIKERNINPYSIPCIHRPNSELPHDCVSEGIGYGMMLALYMNDQEYFNKIWNAGEQYMWNGTLYNWRINVSGTTIGFGAATDAEEDIAAMLIFADALVKKGVWQPYRSVKNRDYAERAQIIIDQLWSRGFYNGLLMPGYGWGASEGFWNPAYFAPAFFRIFAEFDSNTDRNWHSMIDKGYEIIALNPGYKFGMVPDWASHDGSLTPQGPGYNAFLNGDSFYKDAIRILWRYAKDYAWFGEPRAKEFLENAIKFIKRPENSNFYHLDGRPYEESLSFILGNSVSRKRSEHSALTVGMWLTTIVVSDQSEYIHPFLNHMETFYEDEATFWGKSNDPIFQEDTLHNEMYFDQFLAWFGVSLISGDFRNVLSDIHLDQNDRKESPFISTVIKKIPSRKSTLQM